MGGTTTKIKYTVSKVFYFEAAHRLLKNYSGKCNNNHGHSWKIKVSVSGYKLDNKDMVIDFNDLKAIGKWMMDHLDHTSILEKNDPMLEYIKSTGQRYYVTNDNPTSEVIGKIIFDKANEMFTTENTWVESVEVNETCTSAAIITSAT